MARPAPAARASAGPASPTRCAPCRRPPSRPARQPRRRLAYDELLADQVALAWCAARVRAPARPRARRRRRAARRGAGAVRPRADRGRRLQALAEIDADLAAPRRMLRLLQGDVGSGKTLVAVLAMLRAVEAGAQAALMAPTEMLAKQHHRTLSRAVARCRSRC